jgi:hypothetical protein
MKYIAIHDASGTIEAVIAHPDDAPAASFAAQIGHRATPVQAPALKVDADDPNTLEQLREIVAEYRLEPAREAKLTRGPKRRS